MMPRSGGKWHRCNVASCRIQQRNISLKCFIWIVAWLSAAALTQANLSAAAFSEASQTSTSSTSAPLSDVTSAPVSLGAISNSAECGANEFQCKSDHLCIPLARVADGLRDCADGSDECDNESQFRCRCGSPVCIDRAHVMDGQIHCEDGSDEGLESTITGCMSNELSAGIAAFSDGTGKKKVENFVDTGQSVKSGLPTTKNSANFIEFTGTFLPFNEIAPTQLQYYPIHSASETFSSGSVIEITGTFIPKQVTSSASTLDVSTPATEQTEPTTETAPTAPEDEDELLWSVRGTNQTYLVGSQSIMLFTGSYNAPTGATSQGFVFACAKPRHSSVKNCHEVPVKLSLQRETTLPGQSQSVMLVDVFSNEVLLRIFAPLEKQVSDRVKHVEARFGRFIIPGVTISDIEKIELNKESQRVPISVRDYVEFKISPNPSQKLNLEIADLRNMSTSGSEGSTSSVATTSTSLIHLEPSSVLPLSSKQMRTHTVGNLNEHFSSVQSPGAITKSLQSYFSNRHIPTYGPTRLEPIPILAVETKVSASQTREIRDTSTIFGFIDFTTVVNNTLLIFTPKLKAEIGSSSKVPRIEPTRAAIFRDFVSPTTTASSLNPSEESSSASSLIDPVFEINSAKQEAPPFADSKLEMTSIASASSFEADLLDDEHIASEQLENGHISSVSGITITSGFILPSFSVQETSPSSFPASPDVSTIATSVRNQVKEENGQTVEQSNKLTTASDVVFRSDETVQPTRPLRLKTFYTTYTHYTTFQDDQTQFVHSRKEVVTNLVDEIDLADTTDISATATSSTQFNTLQSSATLSDAGDIQSPGLSPSSAPMETKLVATPSLVDFYLRSTVASSNVQESDATSASNSTTAPLNKSYLGKLLSGIAVPITHYTTFTYYTTYFKDMASQIVSRTKVVSNVVTGTINLNQAIQKRSTDYAASPQDIVPEGAENLPIVITPVTEFATSTFYTTFFVPGQGSTVVTNTQILSKVYLPEFSKVSRQRQSATTRPTKVPQSTLGRLTAQTEITRLINGLPVLENGDLLLPSTNSAQNAPYSEEPEAELIKPTVTRKRVVVTRTRTLPNAHKSLGGLPRKSTVVVRGPPRSLADSAVATEDPHGHQLGRLHPSVTPTPVTFFTTYTYFTTELVNGSPVVRSNEHLFSTVITGKILPTRVQPTLHQRVKRTAVLGSPAVPEELAEEITDNKIDSKSAKTNNSKPTGVVSEVTNKSGLHTVVTQIIGTMINGFYAQFAVTKTLEPKLMMVSAESIETNNLVDQSESSEVTTESTEIEVQTEAETTTVPTTSETTTDSSEEQSDGTVTPADLTIDEVTTEANLESVADVLPSSNQSSNSTLDIHQSESITVKGENSSGTVEQTASSVLEHTTQTESFAKKKNSSTLEPLQPSVSLTPSSVSVSPTPTLPVSQGSSSSSSTSESINIDYRTGLISSIVESITAGNQVTRITREVFGTYIAGIYAHLAKTRSDTIELTRESKTPSTLSTSAQPLPAPTASISMPLESGLSSAAHDVFLASLPSTLSTSIPPSSLWQSQSVSVSASPSSEVSSSLSASSSAEQSTSATVADSQQATPITATSASTWSMLPGLSTVSLSTETVNQTILVHTTEYYTTEINGFTAHYSRSTSNVAGTIEPTSAITNRPSIHFPTPVRFLFSTKYPESSNTGSISTVSDLNEPPKSSRKFKELYGDEHDYYDEPLPFAPSVGHLPRSRIIREKDSQPVVEYEYDLDYADNSEQSMPPEPSKPTSTAEQTSTYGYVNQRAQQQARAYNSQSYGSSRRATGGFGARVRPNDNQDHHVAPAVNYRVSEESQPVQPRARQSTSRTAAGLSNRRRQSGRASSVAPSRSLDYYNINDYASTARASHPSNDIVSDSRSSSSDMNTRVSAVSRNGGSAQTEYRRPINRQRQINRQRRPYSSTTTTTTTTTTTPAPRNYALLPNQRLRLNRKYNRNRMHETTNNVRLQTVDHDLNRERSEVHKERVRYRGPSKPAGFRQFGQTSRSAPPRETYEMYQANSVYATPTVPRLPITVTSIVTTVKTVPIFHGFRTSYATLTTTSLNTSVIPQSLYETSVNEDGLTKTLFTKMTDPAEPNKVTEILVTTSTLQEVRRVPLKFGYSTRTETLTDLKTFTMLTTLVHTHSQELPMLPPPGASLLTTVTTFVTTQTLSSTTAVSLLLHGKTLVSTLTFTSLAESTVTKTETLTVAASQVQPPPIVTLLTLSITGDNGEVTELVTALTVPVQQMLHTKVERDVKATSSFSLEGHRHRPRHNHIVLESSTSPLHNNYLSASFKTVEQYSETHPFFITTIFKGPNTEIYEAQATKISGDNENSFDDSPVVFRKRKLHQFNDNLYKEPPVLATEDNFDSISSSKPQTQRKPSFQRIRIKSRPNARPESPKSTGESRLSEFNRLVGLSEPGTFAASPSANSFRRLPISREPLPNVYSSAPSSVYTFPSSSASYLLANNFQKPTFRKIKPANNNRRIVSSIRTMQPIIVSSVIQPSHVFASSLVHNYNSNFMEIAKAPSLGRPNVPKPAQYQPQASHLQPELQPIRADHRPLSNVNPPRNRFNSADGFDDFDSSGHKQEFSDNYIGSLRGPTVAQDAFATQAEASVHTPTIPLTYYTRFTYLTTVIRGPHTAHLSRESVTSAITTRALDKSIVEIVRDSDGVIEPTKVLQLGVKTKGFTTTVYNAVSQVQIYNEDLYNVIQKTYNKNINFKPWQSSSAIYQPVFLTNHVEPSRESSRVWPSATISSFPLNVYSSQVINHNDALYSSVSIDASPAQDDSFLFSTPSVHFVTPVLASSQEIPSHEPLASVIRTPTIEETSLLISPVASRPVRISSSVLVRKPINSKYSYLYPRSRVRVRVKSTNSESAMPASSEFPPELSSSFTESYEVESAVPTESTTVSKPDRIRTTKSTIVFRPRNTNSLNSKMVRISSRVIRPSATSNLLSTSSMTQVGDLPSESSFEAELPTMTETPLDEAHHLDSIAHSDNARANKFTRVSNGVTLIISSKVVSTQSRPFTLEPTLVTGAAVLMKHISPSEQSMAEIPAEPRKQYTTYHTFVSGSKATVTNTDSPIEPSTTTETVQVLRTSTLYSTLTYYATLFNGSASTITPIEDVKTEYITFPATTVLTRTVEPSKQVDGDQITQTHFTNLATVFSNSKPVVSTQQEVVSSEVVLPNAHSKLFTMPSFTSPSETSKPAVTTTRSTHTTLTHFITLFSGTHTILSSIEEISPTVVTEIVGQSSTTQAADRVNMPHIRFTQPSIDHAKQSKNLFGGLVPSVSTLFTTHTYYTTLFSGTTSIIQSRKETTHSLITLYVPSSLSIQPSATLGGSLPPVATTTNSIEPSLRVESSILMSSSYVPDLIGGTLNSLEPSIVVEGGSSHSSQTPSLGEDAGVVFFTNFILPSRVSESENTIDQAKGPIHDVSSLMNHGQLSAQDELLKPDQATKPLSVPSITLVHDNAVQPSAPQNNTIKPGAIIELSDLLDGANLAGNIGEAIKDIVQILQKGQKNKPLGADEIDRTSAVQEMPPKEGATVSHLDDPVYIPMHPAKSETQFEATSTVEIPPVAYVPSSPSPIASKSSVRVLPTFIWSGELPIASTSSPSKSSLGASIESSLESSGFVTPKMAPTSISNAEETRYFTNVEETPSTVVLTTTKVYYTRDAPLTITSEYVSTLPPKTLVTTIAGTKTTVNTYSGEIKPTSTVSKQPAITAVHVAGTPSKPDSSGRPFRPTRKPGVSRFKPPSRPTDAPKIFKTSHRPRAPYKPSPTPPPEFVPDSNAKGSFKKSTKAFMPKTTTRPSILDLDQCKPACNAANKEICKEFAGKFKCDCRSGYIKKPGSDNCYELQNFIVLVRVTKLGESDIVWQSDLLNHTSEQYMSLAKAARSQLDSVQVTEELKDNYIGSDVMSIEQAVDGHGVLVNLTIHLTEGDNLDEDLLKEKLARTLEKSSEQLPSPSQVYADLEDVVDFDECSSEEYNDCATSARCTNLPGTYRCECLNGYPDLDLSFPGRMCASEIKACEFCNGHGDCFRDETGQISSCKCHRMYLGRRCDINGLLLAIFIPVFAILCIVSICLVAYCCRKWKNRALAKGFRNFSAYGPNMIGNTLDRKAMLETSSDNSDPLRSHISYEGPGMTSAEATLPRDYRRRRESDHSSDRSLGSMQAATAAANYNFSPQFMIPRVRNTTTPAANSHYSQQPHYGRSHRHSHHPAATPSHYSTGHHHGGGHSHGHTHSHHGSSHNHGHHSHHGSSYDLHEHPNQRGHHSYMW